MSLVVWVISISISSSLPSPLISPNRYNCQWRLKNPQKWRPKIPHPRKSITLSKREVDYARHGGTIYDTPPIE